MEQHHPETAQPVVPAHEREQQQNSSAKYEGLLATLVQCAPPDVPEEQLVLQFASALPPGEQADFLAWWQCKQEEQQAADTQPETASARSELFLQASPSVPPVMVSSSPPNTHQPPICFL